jgi:putative transposase
MRKSRFTEAQIIQILAENDAGTPTDELARRNGIHSYAIRLWRSKDAGMNASDLALTTLLPHVSQKFRVFSGAALWLAYR